MGGSSPGTGIGYRKRWGETERAAEFAEVMGCCCPEKKNTVRTTAGKLMAINVYHEQSIGLSMHLGDPLMRSVKQ